MSGFIETVSMSTSRRTFLKSIAGAAGSLPLLAGQSEESSTVDPNAMPKRKFGRHDEMLSVVGLGGHTLYLSGSKEEARKISLDAINKGVNFFDNSWSYHGGKAEEYMGYALEGHRDDIFLMTKVCTYNKPFPQGGKEGAMKMLEDSLRRLKTDHLDLWMIHMVNNEQQIEKAYMKCGVLEAMELAKEQGKNSNTFSDIMRKLGWKKGGVKKIKEQEGWKTYRIWIPIDSD